MIVGRRRGMRTEFLTALCSRWFVGSEAERPPAKAI
jgi:hypothetical protein